MGNTIPAFEIENSEGSTQCFEGVTNVTPNQIGAIPAVPSNNIESFIFQNEADDSRENDKIQISMDGGVTFLTLNFGDFFQWKPINCKQIVYKSSASQVPFKAVINFEGFA
jgi:hypothetical protein